MNDLKELFEIVTDWFDVTDIYDERDNTNFEINEEDNCVQLINDMGAPSTSDAIYDLVQSGYFKGAKDLGINWFSMDEEDWAKLKKAFPNGSKIFGDIRVTIGEPDGEGEPLQFFWD